MWVFSILFLVSAIVLIVGLIMLISKRTRQKGKIIATSFLALSVIFYSVSRFGGNDYPNDKPGTITKGEYKQIKEGMSKDQVKDILGEPDSKNDDINEWNYIGIDGEKPDAIVSFEFDPGDNLELKLDGGLMPASKTSKPLEESITKEKYNQIKIGMTMKDTSHIIGKKPSDDYIANYYGNGNETWNLYGKNDSSISLSFENNKLVEKTETGLLSNNSNTITDKNGARDYKSSETAKEDNSDYKNEVESTIKSVIDKDFTFDTTLKKLELNKNEGTNNPNDYVALIYLSYNETHSEKTTKKWIDKYTSHLAAKLAEKEPDITSISIFWETPRFKKDWNTAKFNLTKKDKKFYFDSKNYDGTVFK